MTPRLWPALLLAGCGPGALGRDDAYGPAFRVSGPVSAGVAVTGDRTRGYVAWAWLVDGEMDGVAAEAPFEPLVFAYALDVPPPPDPGAGTDPRPAPDLAIEGVSLLIGLPVLVEPDGDDDPEVEVSPEALWAWGAGEAATPAGAVTVRGGRWAASPAEHALFLAAVPGEAGVRLAALDRWTSGGPLCRLDGAVLGLTPYRAVGTGCLGWEPLAAPGARTEFQGISVSPAP